VAEDDRKTEYHLTPRGWIRGTIRFFSHVQGAEVARPADAVATFQDRIYQRSGWSPEERSFEEIWRSDKTNDPELEALMRKFKRPGAGPKVLDS
jgi:hypothetical protein